MGILLFKVLIGHPYSEGRYMPSEISVMLQNDRMSESYDIWKNTEMGKWACEKKLELKLYSYTDAESLKMVINFYAEVDYITSLEYKEILSLASITDDTLIPKYIVS